MAEAERRREERRSRTAAKSRGRGQSIVTNRKAVEVMPEVSEAKERETPPMTETVAARRLQWWWRSVKRKAAIADFQQLG